MEKILLLGGNGFIGTHFQRVISECYSGDFELIVLGRTSVSAFDFINYSIDLSDFSAIEQILLKEKIDYVVNLAGVNRVELLEKGISSNLVISNNLLQAIAKNKIKHIKKILLIGSASEYGSNQNIPLDEDSVTNPINFYGLSKLYQTLCASFYYRVYNIPVCIARTFNIIGSGTSTASAIGSFKEKIDMSLSDNNRISVGYIDSVRDYLDIDDVIEAYITILKKGDLGEIYNVCSSEGVTMRKILQEMIKISKKNLIIDSLSAPFPYEIEKSVGNNSKLKKIGWDITHSLEQSIKKMMNNEKDFFIYRK